jgi:hypothetical protein
MKKFKLTALIVFCLVLAVSGRARAVSFSFDIPTIPHPPILGDIMNSAVTANSSFTVFATLQGDTQSEACCSLYTACDGSDGCGMDDWYLRDDPAVTPNPACIPNPSGYSGQSPACTTYTTKPNCVNNGCGWTGTACYAYPDSACKKNGNPLLYYYLNGDPAAQGSSSPLEMHYDAGSNQFVADIPTTGLDTGTTITYYIVASDSRGNVVSQIPSLMTSELACSTVDSWNANYETPSLFSTSYHTSTGSTASNPDGNCAFMSGYDRCGGNVAGNPAVCTTDNGTNCCRTNFANGNKFTVYDPQGDTCDVNQNVISGADFVDVQGLAASAGKGFDRLSGQEVICTKIGLKAAPPASGSGAIDAYLMIFFNPDISDPNPADLYMINAFAISYAPRADGADPNLVQVLWDGECITNENTSDLLGCKIFVGSGTENRLSINSYLNGTMRFIALNSLPTINKGTQTIIGGGSKKSTMVFLTGEILISGATAFWLVDITTGMQLVENNNTVTVSTTPIPAAPRYKSTTCKANGSGSSSTCPKSASKPANNVCSITFLPSPDRNITSKYKIYHNTTGVTPTAADYLGASYDVTETTGVSDYTKEYTVPALNLDGKPHHFYLTSVGTNGTDETALTKALSTTCTVEDWVPPAAPINFTCATPAGNEKKCVCGWAPGPVCTTYTAQGACEAVPGCSWGGTPAACSTYDPSIYGYYLWRDAAPLNTTPIRGQSLTDASTSLVNGTPVNYTIKAFDTGTNYSETAAATSCTPEDLKAPEKPGIALERTNGVIGVKVSWTPNTETDMEKYDVYACKNTAATNNCMNTNGVGYTKIVADIAQPISPDTITKSYECDDVIIPCEEQEWCFMVNACDNCATEGTCPSNGSGNANCSGFSTSKPYRQCLLLSMVPDPDAPLFPDNQAATVKAEGNTCEVTWDRVCEDEAGVFTNCDYPAPLQLTGYKIMRATPASGQTCASTVLSTPGTGTPVGQKTDTSGTMSYTDKGLTNGTTYCYRVYGSDGAGLFSREDPPPTPVSCVPADTTAPAKPDMDDVFDYDDLSCTPSWGAVVDKGTISYNVYKCHGTEATCTTPASYTKLNTTAISTTNYYDEDVTTSESYIYCATAVDSSANESLKYESLSHANCGLCVPSNACPAPTSVMVGDTVDNLGVSVYFTNTSADTGSYTDDVGYFVYLCTGSTVDTCTTKLNTNAIAGNRNSTPYLISAVTVPSEGDYYFAVTYKGADCGESLLSISSNTANIIVVDNDPCTLDPSSCTKQIDFTADGKTGFDFQKYDVVDCTVCSGEDCDCLNGKKKSATGLSGVVVKLLDSSGTVVKSKTTVGGVIPGGFHLALEGGASEDGLVNTTETYKLTAEFPVGTWDAVGALLCSNNYDNSGNYLDTLNPASDVCIRTLNSSVNFGSATPPKATTASVDSPTSSAGGAEVGNTNCDGVVDTTDVLPIKKLYGKTLNVDADYQAGADTNMDGTIDTTDVLLIKKNFMLGYAPDKDNATCYVAP